jgi:uncharacterized protein (UPF0332 family)
VSSPKQQFILYRLDRAREALDDAGFLLQSGRLTGASNRVYYAMFYAASALLATRDLSASRHSGVIALFNDHFVKTGLFPRELARHFGRAFEARMDTDYRVLATPDADELRESLEHARAFISRTEELLKTAEGR